MSLRSPLGRVLGAGSAKGGTAHWWSERVSAIALVPLTLWLLVSLLTLPSLDYDVARAWLAQPVTSFLCVLTVAVTTYHAYLGSTVVIEDYVHTAGLKVFSLLMVRFLHVLFGGGAIFAVLRIAFGT